MTAPPQFEDIVAQGLADVRVALEEMPDATRAEVKQVLDSDELVTRVVNIVLPVMDEQFRKKYYRKIIFAVGGLLVFFAIATAIAFNQIAKVAAINAQTNTNQDAAIERSQISIGAFQDQLAQANAKLAEQGLPTIQAPGNVQPGTPEQAQLSVAAATASTLANLPREVLVKPEPADIAKAVSDYIVANPVPIPPDQIINAVATYMASNQEALRGPEGKNGPAGPPGDPPSAEEIRAAFRAEVAANPQVLCPQGGEYSSKVVLLANGNSAEQTTCFGPEVPPPSGTGGGGILTPDPNAGPTTAPPAPGGGVTQPPPATSDPPTPTTTPEGGLF
jgi:hypothetical protein